MKIGEAEAWLHSVNKDTWFVNDEDRGKIMEEYAEILLMLLERVEKLEERLDKVQVDY